MILRFGILTSSDRAARGQRPDLSGPALAEIVTAQGWEVKKTAILPDELPGLRTTLSAWADEGGLDIILTTGGTGFAPRDVTPEALEAGLRMAVENIWEFLAGRPAHVVIA